MHKDYLVEGKKCWFWFMIGIFVFGVYLVSIPISEAADYPTKAVRIICPWSAGGGVDTVTRVFSVRLAKKWGVPVSVINKAGGMGIPGTLEVMQSDPDGYTVLIECNGSSSLLDAWGKNVPFDIRDRTYMANAADTPFLFLVRVDSPWKTLADIEGAINQNPSGIRWGWMGGTGGQDAVIHQSLIHLRKKVGAEKVKQIKLITYTGSPQILAALAGGHIDIATPSAPNTTGLVSAGKARVLAVAYKKRIQMYPDVPTTEELGWPDVNNVMWLGFSGPKGIAPNVVQAWEKVIQDMIKEDPSLKADLEKFGAVQNFMNAEDLRKFVLDEASAFKSYPR